MISETQDLTPIFPNVFNFPSPSIGDCLSESVSLQLFPVVEEIMLQPLWESRDRYEELKQIDDAMKEVNGCAAEKA